MADQLNSIYADNSHLNIQLLVKQINSISVLIMLKNEGNYYNLAYILFSRYRKLAKS